MAHNLNISLIADFRRSPVMRAILRCMESQWIKSKICASQSSEDMMWILRAAVSSV